MITAHMDGTREFATAMERAKQRAVKARTSILRMAGNSLAREAVGATVPITGLDVYRARTIPAQIGRTTLAPGQAWRIIRDNLDRSEASWFWSALHDGDQAVVRQVLDTAGIPHGRWHDKIHKDARVAGRVPRRHRPEEYWVRGWTGSSGNWHAPRSMAAYIKRTAKRGGMAKAVWIHAARSVGARPTGKGRLPSEYGRVAGARAMAGGVLRAGAASGAEVRLINRLPYAEEAIARGQTLEAVENKAATRFEAALSERFARSRGRRKTARRVSGHGVQRGLDLVPQM